MLVRRRVERRRRETNCGRPGWPLDLNDVDGSYRVIHRGMIRGRLAQLRAWILPAWADSGFDREVRSVVGDRAHRKQSERAVTMSLKLCRNFLDDFDAVGAVAVDGENVVGDINQEG